jgi:predicted membrane channel-forming protein YqfA (hemolysin III family)
MKSNHNLVRKIGITCAASIISVEIAFSPMLAAGWWHRNVFAIGENLLLAGILSLLFLLAEQTKRPALVHAGIASLAVIGIIFAMTQFIPRENWVFFLPMFGFIALAWTGVIPIRRSIENYWKEPTDGLS